MDFVRLLRGDDEFQADHTFARLVYHFRRLLRPEFEKVTPGAADRIELDDLRVQGYEALYSLDYETANRTFKEMVRLFPDHPAGPQCLAATLWVQELNRSRLRQASLYSDESFYSATRSRSRAWLSNFTIGPGQRRNSPKPD